MCDVKSTKYQVSVSNTATEATGFRSIPTRIHKHPRSFSCHVPCCPTPSQHNSHRTRFNELPQTHFPITHLGDDVFNDSILVESAPPVDACSQRATRRTILTSVTQDQSSRRRALKAASSHKPNLYPHTACNPSALHSSLSQQHRHGSQRIQVHTNQNPQVPTFSLVPCPTLPNTVPTYITLDATKHAFHQQFHLSVLSFRDLGGQLKKSCLSRSC